jgi:hypothetical protein
MRVVVPLVKRKRLHDATPPAHHARAYYSINSHQRLGQDEKCGQ